MTKKKNGFTLIEIIAVLVIMAILALIVTPLVMNIIRKSRIAADKRSIDAYGRSIELAIAGYLMDTGTFPTSVDQLTIEYSGNKVECSTTQLNPDSSVYLTGCTVGGRTVDYTYGGDKSPSYTAYAVGNQLTYNGVDYYVIKDSGVKESTVTLLKATPLTVDEPNVLI
jgi:prepilin-type N-terminal cleavage/methylation domain-containing protein